MKAFTRILAISCLALAWPSLQRPPRIRTNP